MSIYKKQEEELIKLINRGMMLLAKMAYDQNSLPKEQVEEFKNTLDNIIFVDAYNEWYTESLSVIKQLIPDRLENFISLYKNEKRKEILYDNYSIYDYMIGLTITTAFGETKRGPSDALKKMEQQCYILKSAQKKLHSYLFDLKEVVQAELFDSELDSAKELAKKGFFRAGGAVAGVVLEKHLWKVCGIHAINFKKKNPTIADFNDALKDGNVIDIPKWRYVQHLADMRNLCDHAKEREPTKEDVFELIEGVTKVTKTFF
ncbi:MAG: hypothetical protein LBV80_12260 [Deltaproteobacteria bacterium]|jgi:hypothetical protein|nr:hypothetical protein [Deltaproteobacteria bacterium]